MFERLKKFKQLYKVVSTKGIVEPPVRILKKLPYKRLPDKIFNEVKGKKKTLPFKTLLYLYDWLKYETITQMPDKRFVINTFLPPMPGKSYEKMFENLTSGRRMSPVSAYIAVSSKCCYDCWHCSYKKRLGEDLSTDQVLHVIDQLNQIGTSIIGITGGEPTLHKDIVKIVHNASIESDSVIFTNGFNFTDELAAKLKNVGLWAVSVSLDSDIPEVHNKKRGNNQAYDRAINAIKVSHKYGFYTMASTVADIDVIKNKTYQKIYDLVKQLGVDEYRLVEPMPSGKLITCNDCLLNYQLREELKQFHRNINKNNMRPKVCSFALVESGEYFGCCAGTMHLFIDSKGNVCPCDFTPLSFGNIKEIPLIEAWQRLNDAFKMPRYNCFIQENYRLIQKYYSENLPLNYDETLKVFNEVPEANLPDYFKHVLSQKESS